jgi:hypothetical protein
LLLIFCMTKEKQLDKIIRFMFYDVSNHLLKGGRSYNGYNLFPMNTDQFNYRWGSCIYLVVNICWLGVWYCLFFYFSFILPKENRPWNDNIYVTATTDQGPVPRPPVEVPCYLLQAAGGSSLPPDHPNCECLHILLTANCSIVWDLTWKSIENVDCILLLCFLIVGHIWLTGQNHDEKSA